MKVRGRFLSLEIDQTIMRERKTIRWELEEKMKEKRKGKKREKEREIKKMGECDMWLITTQIILFHTLNTPDFEHFLRSNQPN